MRHFNREIKFRAWDVLGKLMVYPGAETGRGVDGDEHIGYVYLVPSDHAGKFYELTVIDHSRVDKMEFEGVLMQFTGLADRLGKEIYEGDIVKIAVNPYHGNYEVKFGEYKLALQHKHQIERPAVGWFLQKGFDILSLMYAVKQDTSYGASSHSVEVIGNIMENPELLEAAK